ncbi:hypothetical protein EDC04DRAFT_2603457, partial [Pisolithus marmoratus]
LTAGVDEYATGALAVLKFHHKDYSKVNKQFFGHHQQYQECAAPPKPREVLKILPYKDVFPEKLQFLQVSSISQYEKSGCPVGGLDLGAPSGQSWLEGDLLDILGWLAS